MILALLAIVVFFTAIVGMQDIDFLSAQNITNLFLQNSYVIIMALGMLLVIVAGHIDLSVGSVVGFTGAVAAVLTVNTRYRGAEVADRVMVHTKLVPDLGLMVIVRTLRIQPRAGIELPAQNDDRTARLAQG